MNKLEKFKELLELLKKYLYRLVTSNQIIFAIHSAFDELVQAGWSENDALNICDLFDCMVREYTNM